MPDKEGERKKKRHDTIRRRQMSWKLMIIICLWDKHRSKVGGRPFATGNGETETQHGSNLSIGDHSTCER